MTNEGEKSTLGKLISWFFLALLFIGALKLAFWLVAAAVGFGTWVLFTLGPILLVGWLVLKLLRYFARPRGYDADGFR